MIISKLYPIVADPKIRFPFRRGRAKKTIINADCHVAIDVKAQSAKAMVGENRRRLRAVDSNEPSSPIGEHKVICTQHRGRTPQAPSDIRRNQALSRTLDDQVSQQRRIYEAAISLRGPTDRFDCVIGSAGFQLRREPGRDEESARHAELKSRIKLDLDPGE